MSHAEGDECAGRMGGLFLIMSGATQKEGWENLIKAQPHDILSHKRFIIFLLPSNHMRTNSVLSASSVAYKKKSCFRVFTLETCQCHKQIIITRIDTVLLCNNVKLEWEEVKCKNMSDCRE